jgi:hypothetical protein
VLHPGDGRLPAEAEVFGDRLIYGQLGEALPVPVVGAAAERHELVQLPLLPRWLLALLAALPALIVAATVTCAKPGTPATGVQAPNCLQLLNVSGDLVG